MDQSSVLSDALLKTTSSLGNLLAQLESAGGTVDTSGMFSTLLADGGNSNAAQQLLASVQTNTTDDTATSSAADAQMQSLNDLSSTLRQIIHQLEQQNTDSAPPQTAANQSAPQTQDQQTQVESQTTKDAASTANSGSSSPTATTQTTTSADSSPTQPDADAQILAIIAALLALTQAAIKDLQGKNGATAAAISGTTSANSGANSLDQLVAGLQQALLALQTTMQKTATTTDASGANSLAANSQITAQLSDFENGMQAVLSALQQQEKTAQNPDIAAQLAAFDASLKNVLAALQPQTATSKQQNVSSSSLTQQTAAQTASLLTDKGFKNAASVAPQTSPSSQETTSQNQNTSASAPEPAKAPTSAVQSQNAPAVEGNAQPAAVSSLTNQNFTPAALSADKDSGGSGFNSGSNNLNGGNGSGASIDSMNGITAGGAQAAGTYSFASTLSALRAASGGTAGLPSVVDQVILQMNRNVKNGNDQMSLQLQPGDLGKITVKLDFSSDGKVQGTVTADSPQTLSMLQKDSRSLERALQDAGLRADPGSLHFNLSGQNNGGQTTANGNNTTGASGNGTLSAENTTDDASGLVAIGTLAETYYVTPGGVNIRV